MSGFDADRPTAGLDPEVGDPGYWHRFQVRVLERAAAELARRRLARQPTVTDLVASWWRMLVPAAMATAALAAMVLFASNGPLHQPAPVGIDEALLAELGDELFAAVIMSDGTPDAAMVLEAVEGR